MSLAMENGQWNRLGPEGLQFYGRMSASISHEIKNVLAIINENAGLLHDLSLLAGQGVALDPRRLESIAATVIKQVRRADEIVGNMNRFAHSADQWQAEVDPVAGVELVLALARRFAVNRGVGLAFDPPPVRRLVRVAPFFLANLLWLGLDYAMEQVGSGKTVLIKLTDDNGQVDFSYQPVVLPEQAPLFAADQRVEALAARLGADLWQDRAAGRFGFRLAAYGEVVKS